MNSPLHIDQGQDTLVWSCDDPFICLRNLWATPHILASGRLGYSCVIIQLITFQLSCIFYCTDRTHSNITSSSWWSTSLACRVSLSSLSAAYFHAQLWFILLWPIVSRLVTRKFEKYCFTLSVYQSQLNHYSRWVARWFCQWLHLTNFATM